MAFLRKGVSSLLCHLPLPSPRPLEPVSGLVPGAEARLPSVARRLVASARTTELRQSVALCLSLPSWWRRGAYRKSSGLKGAHQRSTAGHRPFNSQIINALAWSDPGRQSRRGTTNGLVMSEAHLATSTFQRQDSSLGLRGQIG